MTLTLIAAFDEQRTLGRNNELIWRLPDDLKHFKSKTSGHAVIMGRKTFDSLNGKPLPNRHNIVITRQDDFNFPGVTVVSGIEEAIAAAGDDNQPYVVGGAQIYTLALPIADRLEITFIHHKFDGGDAFFPEISEEEWELVKSVHHPADERHGYAFDFKCYDRKR